MLTKENAEAATGVTAGLLATANTAYDASEANVTTHTTEKAAFVAVFDTATELVTSTTLAYNDALKEWE